jgi:hypothetical protein
VELREELCQPLQLVPVEAVPCSSQEREERTCKVKTFQCLLESFRGPEEISIEHAFSTTKICAIFIAVKFDQNDSEKK